MVVLILSKPLGSLDPKFEGYPPPIPPSKAASI
jgi:hypothetical protein